MPISYKGTILLFGPLYDELAGNWSYFKEMAKVLSKNGYKIIFISPHFNKINKRYFLDDDIMVYRVSAYSFLLNPIDFIYIISYIFNNNEKIDLIYDTASGVYHFTFFISIYLFLHQKTIPIITHFMGELKGAAHNKIFNLLFEIYLNIVTRINIKLSAKICVVGENIISRVVKLGVNYQKITIVPPGHKYTNLILDKFKDINKKNETDINLIRNEFSLGKNDFVIGYVGYISEDKGIITLFKAVSILPNLPAIKLMIVGDAGQRKNYFIYYAKKLKIYDNIIFTGYRTDVIRLMNVFDIFINLSYSEGGVPATQIEAMSLAKPSIITPFTNLITDGQETIIVPFGDSDKVTEAINLLYYDKNFRDLIGENAYKKSKILIKKYSWDNYIKKMNLIFEEVKAKTK